MPQLTRQIIDKAYPARDLKLFLVISAAMVGINLASAVLQAIQSYYAAYVSNVVSFRVRMQVFRAIHHVPIQYAEGHHTGSIIERTSTDAEAAANGIVSVVPQFASLLLATGVAVILMMKINLTLTCLILLCVPVYLAFNIILTGKLGNLESEMRRRADQLTALAEEAIRGIPTAKLFGAGKWLSCSYRKSLRDKVLIAFGIWRAQLIFGRLGWAVTYGWGVVLTCGGWYLVFQDRLLLGEAVALGMYIPLLLRPAEEAMRMYRSLMSSSVAAQRIASLITASQNSKGTARRLPPPNFGHICLRGVTFAYPRGSPCLRSISLEFENGRTTVVLGPTGSGKTTLLKLLAGFYEGYDGEITVEGHRLKNIRIQDYQANVAMVMAENFFFSGSIMENLQIARSQVREDEIRRAADLLGIDRMIQATPRGYQTRLGVGGVRLSSGQCQALALLRALLKKPKLLLLDEVTSAMDIESERTVLDGIQQLRPGNCATVITTHRLAITLEPWVDHVAVLGNGEILERGSASELFSRNGKYRKLMGLSGLGVLVERSRLPTFSHGLKTSAATVS
jgi:ABC-type bacteriocin/lantibiotic exporter with double-glycine peptidase domain